MIGGGGRGEKDVRGRSKRRKLTEIMFLTCV
jgi:hypothetical protein